MKHFLDKIRTHVTRLTKKLKFMKKLVMTPEDTEKHEAATTCALCGDMFDDTIGGRKVKDHDHVTGEYRQALHSRCNSRLQHARFIPIYVHNLRGYDSHLIIKALGSEYTLNPEGEEDGDQLDCIPCNMEKYMSFSWSWTIFPKTDKYKALHGCAKFLDSMQFMGDSLDNLAKNLPNQKKYITRKFVTGRRQRKIAYRKGLFPYEWFDSMDKLECTSLPDRKDFTSKVGGGVGHKEYKRAQKAWVKLGCKTFKDYLMWYQCFDVYLLADVFQAFRHTCFKIYDLDPAMYLTAPHFFWDAALKKTRVKLDLISDIEMYRMIEAGIRGGISMISHRHAVADNPITNPDRRPDDPDNKWIVYLDANNLYGVAMVQKLPVGDYKWVTPEEFDVNTDCQGDTGYIVRVDLEYPSELHDLHNMYPLAPDRMKVEEEMLTTCQHSILKKSGSRHTPTEKLIPNLMHKKDYVVHLSVLQLYMKLGLRVTKVTDVISFKQAAWLKPYIEMNTQLRTKAANDFEKDLYKLANNSVFGKTMENVREREKVLLVSSERRFRTIAAKSTFSGRWLKINDGLQAMHLKNHRVLLNKPIAVGMSILDLSKAHMYDFHYSVMLPKYGVDRLQLLFTDTDSLCYQIKTPNVYTDMFGMKELFDFSGYNKSSPYFDKTNAKVLGKMKDESGGDAIIEFIGLKPKMYAYKTVGGRKGAKAKGTKKSNVKKMPIDRYRDILMNQNFDRETQYRLISKGHVIHTQELRKTALNAFDDKRAILADGVSSLAWGHYKLDM